MPVTRALSASCRRLSILALTLVVATSTACKESNGSKKRDSSEPPSVDPDGTWSVELTLEEATGDCSGSEGTMLEFETTILRLDDRDYELRFTTEGGEPASIDGRLSGDRLILEGGYLDRDVGEEWYVELLSGSELRLGDDTLEGSVRTRLTGDVECTERLSVQGVRRDDDDGGGGGGDDGLPAGQYVGTWSPTCYGCTAVANQPMSATWSPDTSKLVFEFEYDFTGFIGNSCSGGVIWDDIDVGADGRFSASGYLDTAFLQIEGVLVDDSPSIEGILSFENGPGCIVNAEGPFRLL